MVTALSTEKTPVLRVVILVNFYAVITALRDTNLIPTERPVDEFLEGWMLR